MEMISHISFSVSDLDRSTKFYNAIFNTLGIQCVYSSNTATGWGPSQHQEKFSIKKRVDKPQTPSTGFHLAFHAKSQIEVEKFHKVALENGGKDNGLPGPRPEYGPNYYAAYVIDPDGYEIEVKYFIDNK